MRDYYASAKGQVVYVHDAHGRCVARLSPTTGEFFRPEFCEAYTIENLSFDSFRELCKKDFPGVELEERHRPLWDKGAPP